MTRKYIPAPNIRLRWQLKVSSEYLEYLSRRKAVFILIGSKNAEPACKPGSVVDSHSSGTTVTGCLERPTRTQCGPHRWVPIWSCSGWGLPCHACYQPRGALLPHRFTLTCRPRPTSAVCFLLHFPWARAPQALPGTLPCGARTFLPATHRRGAPRRHCPPLESDRATARPTLPAEYISARHPCRAGRAPRGKERYARGP